MGGKARPSRSIKKISGKLPEILQGAVAKCILQRPREILARTDYFSSSSLLSSVIKLLISLNWR